jgi:ApaG protein
MVSQITRGIRFPFLGELVLVLTSKYKIHFAFSYGITIENHSKDSVQLTSRHFKIYDSLNDLEFCSGEGSYRQNLF